MMKRFYFILFILFCIPGLANDDEKRERAQKHFQEARRLLIKRFDTAMRVQDSQRMASALNEFRQGFAQLCDIAPAHRTEQDLKDIYYAAMHFAGKDQVSPGCCMLCLQKKKLAGSHVVPNAVLARLVCPVDDTGKLLKADSSIGSTRRPNAEIATTSATWPLFCKPGCEDVFSSLGETKFSPYFWLFVKRFSEECKQGTRDNRRPFVEKEGENCTHFCVASILFRYMLINGFDDLRRGAQDASAMTAYWQLFFVLRNYMLDPEHAVAPYIHLFISENDLAQRHLITTLLFNGPEAGRPCFVTAHFEWGGFHFVVAASDEIARIYPELLEVPADSFHQVIEVQKAPDRLRIDVQPKLRLCLPTVAERAREFDSVALFNMFARRSPVTVSRNGIDYISIPAHPLAGALFRSAPPSHVQRLTDDVTIERDQHTATPHLRFSDPGKNFVFAEADYRAGESTCDIWICKNVLAKKDAFRTFLCLGTKQASLSFGYHLPDELFKYDLRLAAQQALKVSTEQDFAPVETFLGAKPLKGTSHEPFKDVTRSLRIFSTIVDVLEGWWEKLANAVPVPQRFVAERDGRPVRFVETLVPRDNDCGFHILGTTREDAIKLLLANAERDDIREMVAHDIFAAFIDDTLPQKLRIESLVEARNRYEVAVDQTHRLENRLRELLPSSYRDLVGQAEQFPQLKSMFVDALVEQDIPSELRVLEELGKLYEEQDKIVSSIRKWARKPGVFQNFITEFLRQEHQWLTYLPGQTGLLDALALLLGVQVDIWVPSQTDPQRLVQVLHAGALHNPEARHIDAVHRDRLTHFNLLALEQREEREVNVVTRSAFSFGSHGL